MNRQSLQTAALLGLVTAIGLFYPFNARADATAGSLLTFTSLSITPDAGSFQLVTNWQGATYAQATLTAQYDSGTSPAATALGDYSLGQGAASATSPVSATGHRLKFFYATQVRQAPPTFLLFVNRDELFSALYKKYLANELRRAFGYEGCPIVLVPKPRPKTVEPVRKHRRNRNFG